jgi:hypothetical protein
MNLGKGCLVQSLALTPVTRRKFIMMDKVIKEKIVLTGLGLSLVLVASIPPKYIMAADGS